MALERGGKPGQIRAMKILILMAMSLVLTALGAVAGEPVMMKPLEVRKWLGDTPQAQVLDVRTKEEFETGRLAGAVLIPWTDGDFKERVAAELKKDQPVFLYCRSGGRSAGAAKALVELGFTNVRELKGGMLAWRKAGQPVVPAK
jgi:rhodanese-related sulfurtransferase